MIYAYLFILWMYEYRKVSDVKLYVIYGGANKTAAPTNFSVRDKLDVNL